MSRSIRAALGASLAALVVSVAVSAPAVATVHAAAPQQPQRRAVVAANPYGPFLRGWYGHDRILHISRTGLVHEDFLTGCCSPISRYTLQLSRVHRDALGHPVARVRVIAIRIDKGGYRFPGVHVGSVGRAVIKAHVYRDSLLQSTFCDARAPAGTCGA